MIIDDIKLTKTLRFCHKEDILAPHGILSRASYPTNPYCVLTQGTFQTNKRNYLKETKTDSPAILIEKIKAIKTLGFFHGADIYAPRGPLTRYSYPTCPHSCLSQGTIQTDKHYHLKQIRGRVSKNYN